MADILLFSKKQPVEVVKFIEGSFDSCNVEHCVIRLIEGVEYIYTHAALRKVKTRESGQRYVNLYLEADKSKLLGVTIRKISDDEKCNH